MLSVSLVRFSCLLHLTMQHSLSAKVHHRHLLTGAMHHLLGCQLLLQQELLLSGKLRVSLKLLLLQHLALLRHQGCLVVQEELRILGLQLSQICWVQLLTYVLVNLWLNRDVLGLGKLQASCFDLLLVLVLLLEHLLLHLLLLVGLSASSVGLLSLDLLVVLLDLFVHVSLQLARTLWSQLVKLEFHRLVVFVFVDAALHDRQNAMLLLIC